ncbi:MAG: helix-turn-helix transcriptional regulator [Lachnospiraceae bacterium]|nr:helix-turn-helix transcriptional regulator [Lachnospiraceae bacterium]
MLNLKPQKRSQSGQSIVRWFLVCFICFSLIFFIALLPLISYCRNVFTELEIKKSTQQMDFGISQLDNTVTSIASASQTLQSDTRFIPFQYLEPDYSAINITVRNQMRDYLNALVFPLPLVSNCALQFSSTTVITPTLTLFEERPGYYPTLFSVEGLTYEEWEGLLSKNKSGFLPVKRITANGRTYDALIYSIAWTESSYLYVCMNISDVKQALIEKSDLSSYLVTIKNAAGDVLYTDLTNDTSDYHAVTQKTSVGGLTITIHIPHAALTERMSPLYYFLGLYLVLCILAIVITVFIGSHITSRPMLKILHMLEDSDAQTANKSARLTGSAAHRFRQAADLTVINRQRAVDNNRPADRSTIKPGSPLQYGFHYIQNKIQTYETNLNTYRSTIDTQSKVLQARFLEKALHGSLATEEDYHSFFSYFPDFPESFCLIMLGLVERPVEGENIYENPLSLVQFYLQSSLPAVYQQQLNSTELLLIVDEDNFEETSRVLNHLIANINREEPCYHTWGIAGTFYSHPKNIPSAYWQLQDLYSRVSLESLSQLCTVSDYPTAKKPGFQIADAVSIHSAIVYGNKEIALQKLQSYSDSLSAGNRPIFEMIRSILLCIKQEYAGQLINVDVPSYHSHLNMYTKLEETIGLFCDEFRQAKKKLESDAFIQEVLNYIDHHFTEEDLCYATLTEHFQCSTSKLQKAFSREVGVSLSAYIEKRRMELASELLVRGEDSVTEVARKCGFANDNTFYKAYRRTFGHAPTFK